MYICNILYSFLVTSWESNFVFSSKENWKFSCYLNAIRMCICFAFPTSLYHYFCKSDRTSKLKVWIWTWVGLLIFLIMVVPSYLCSYSFGSSCFCCFCCFCYCCLLDNQNCKCHPKWEPDDFVPFPILDGTVEGITRIYCV